MSPRQTGATDDAATTAAKALIATANGDLKKLAINLKAAGSFYTVDNGFIVNLHRNKFAAEPRFLCLGSSTMEGNRPDYGLILPITGTAGRLHEDCRR